MLSHGGNCADSVVSDWRLLSTEDERRSRARLKDLGIAALAAQSSRIASAASVFSENSMSEHAPYRKGSQALHCSNDSSDHKESRHSDWVLTHRTPRV